MDTDKALDRLGELVIDWRRKGGRGTFSSHHLREPVTSPSMGSDREIRRFYKEMVEAGLMREVRDSRNRKTWELVRVKILIDTDSMPRTWKPYEGNEYCAGMWPTEVGEIPLYEYQRLERESVEDSDGWMVERVEGE